MSSTIYLVTVNNTPDMAQELVASVFKDIKHQYDFVHIANCKTITAVKTVLTSLIVTPHVLVTTSEWFEDEQEEVREIAQSLVPNMRLIMIPPGMKAQEGDKTVVEYLKEQIMELKFPTHSAA